LSYPDLFFSFARTSSLRWCAFREREGLLGSWEIVEPLGDESAANGSSPFLHFIYLLISICRLNQSSTEAPDQPGFEPPPLAVSNGGFAVDTCGLDSVVALFSVEAVKLVEDRKILKEWLCSHLKILIMNLTRFRLSTPLICPFLHHIHHFVSLQRSPVVLNEPNPIPGLTSLSMNHGLLNYIIEVFFSS